jgi:UDP-N-acetylmuramoylalanine--D-glutamate ligase
MNLEGKNVAVLGAGRSGCGAALLARRLGASVTVVDEGRAEALAPALEALRGQGFSSFCIGEQATEIEPAGFALAILSPGLDLSWPLPARFAAAAVPVMGETEFGFRHNRAELVAITGTNGKSTCTELVAHLLGACGVSSQPCGNHGRSLSEVVAAGEDCGVLALEISSFQLETIETFRARASIWLNFAADHLDRYPGMEEYFAAKARIFANVTAQDLAVVRSGEHVSSGLARRETFSATGLDSTAFLDQGCFWVGGQRLAPLEASPLRGRHNHENVLAALLALRAHGIEPARALAALGSYEAPRHRCQWVATLAERDFINDSKATNLHALAACVQSLDQPLVLIVGGKQKGLDYQPLIELFRGRVRAAVLIGEIRWQLQELLSAHLPCVCATDMRQAVRLGRDLSQSGDAIVLSPGTSSFDMYRGYAHRGDAFCEAVAELAAS